MSAVAEEVNQKNGWNIMIHVDGASGAFVAPFLYPELVWDFRLKNVVSINASGHKRASSAQNPHSIPRCPGHAGVGLQIRSFVHPA